MTSSALVRSAPLQEQLRQIVRERIISGYYSRGADFPSESDLAQEFDTLVITDEVYKDFVYGDAQVYSAAMDSAARDRVIRVLSGSSPESTAGGEPERSDTPQSSQTEVPSTNSLRHFGQ